jgi:hypothetical protein
MADNATPETMDAWDRVAGELRALRRSQEAAYGSIDAPTLGRYLAGECDAAEQTRIEQAIQTHPELQFLTELVRDVLADTPAMVPEPQTVSPGSTPAAEPAPEILAFAPRKRRPMAWQRVGTLVAAACLCVVLGAGMMPLKGQLGTPPGSPVSVEFGSASRSAPMLAMAPVGDAPPVSVEFGSASRSAPVGDAPPVAKAPVMTTSAPQLGPPTAAGKMRAMRRPGMPEAARRAYHLTQQGLQMHREGRVDQAARSLEQAHEICQNLVGPNHPQTRDVALNLANVYGEAFLRPMPLMREGSTPGTLKVGSVPVDPPTPADSAGIAAADAPRDTVTPVQSLRARLDRKKYTEVQQRVVPMLAMGLKNARTAEQRQSLIHALSQLGPASGTAVGVLADCLDRTEDEREQAALVAALARMGPEARFALPTLNRFANGHDGPQWTTTSQQARSLVGQLHGPAGRVGVSDHAGLFSVGAVREAVAHFQANAGRLEIFVEAPRPGLPTLASARLQRMGPQAIVVLLRRDRAECFPSDRLTIVPADSLPKLAATLTGHLQAGEADEALRAVCGLIPDTAPSPR